MTLTINSPYFIGSPCGHHGHYTFYKAFKYSLRNSCKGKILMLGEFFFLRISPHDDPCIGELQLLWEDSNSDQLLSSTRLYFLPEQTPDGRQPNHGEHEVLAASDKVILRLSDLVSWITDQVDWMTGLQTNTTITPTISNNNNNNGKYHWQSMYPIAINPYRLDFTDVFAEKQLIGDVGSRSSVVVLSYPRYCRYRALLRRIEGKECEFMDKESVRLTINSLGIPTTTSKMNILFCRDTFEHEALLQNDLNCDHLAPKLKGRPRKKLQQSSSVSKSGQRSSSPESNTSDESKTSQIRTTRRSALNRSNSSEKSVTGNVVKNSNKVNNNARLKDICIKNEQTFLKQLNKFMRERKTPIQRVPHLGFKQIDLYFFYTHAQKLGGYDKVTSNKLWKRLYDEMGGDPGSTSAATCTRRHYERLLLPFERHLNGDQHKRKRRKTTTSSSGSVKKGKKQSQSSSANNIKYKKKVGKQVVNGVKDKSKCNDEDNYSDDTTAASESKLQLDDGNKQPKLIVKFNLLKVKNQERDESEHVSDSCEATQELVEDESAKQELVKVNAEYNDSINTVNTVNVDNNNVVNTNNNIDNNDTDIEEEKSDRKELKSEDLTEEEIEDEDDDEEVEDDDEEQEVKNVLKNKSSANTETVIHLSPVSDISTDEVPVCDNKIESSCGAVSTASPTPRQALVSDTKNNSQHNNSSAASSAAPLPFPIAASPLFSISSLVNSVKAESITPPPPPVIASTTQSQSHLRALSPLPLPSPRMATTATSVATLPLRPMSSKAPSLSIKSTSFNIYPRRPSVIHRTSNPIYNMPADVSAKNLIYKSISTENPLPAHCSVKNVCEPKKIPLDYAYNDVLDLSVKKRCFEADSRTSPSQLTIDGSILLDLSVKKKKVESPILQVPKPKLEPVSPTTTLLSQSHKSYPPQSSLNNVSQSVQKSVHYQRALPLFESQAKQSKQHHYHNTLIQSHKQTQQHNHNQLHHHQQQQNQLTKPQSLSPHQVIKSQQISPQQQIIKSQQLSEHVIKSRQLSPHQLIKSQQISPQHVIKPQQQLSPQQIIKPQVRHPQPYVSQSFQTQSKHSQQSEKKVHQQQHRHHNQQQQQQHNSKQYQQSSPSPHHHQQHQQQQSQLLQQRQSPKSSSDLISSKLFQQQSAAMREHFLLSQSSSMKPAISEYNPSLPAFYTTPSYWWQNASPLHSVNLTTASSSSPYISPSMGSLSPQMLMSSPSGSSAQAFQSDHLLSPYEKANFAAHYKQLMDQHIFQQHINNYYTTK